MDKRLELFSPETVMDGYGGLETHWLCAGVVWARVLSAEHGEREAQGAPMDREELRLKIRPRADVKRGWKVRILGEEWLVLDVGRTYRDSAELTLVRYEQGE